MLVLDGGKGRGVGQEVPGLPFSTEMAKCGGEGGVRWSPTNPKNLWYLISLTDGGVSESLRELPGAR